MNGVIRGSRELQFGGSQLLVVAGPGQIEITRAGERNMGEGTLRAQKWQTLRLFLTEGLVQR